MRSWYVLVGLGIAAAFFAIYFPVALAGGFGEVDEPWDKYCERPVGRPVQQPFCFWSAAGFILAGLAALLAMDLTERSADAGLLAVPSAYSIPLGGLMVWLGPGSMLEHGTLNAFWGWFDSASIHWYGIFVVAYVLVRLWCSPRAMSGLGGTLVFWGGYLVLGFLVGLLTGFVAPARDGVTGVLIGALFVFLAGVEAGARFGWWRPGYTREWGWLVPAAVFGVGGLVVLFTSGVGGPLCQSRWEDNPFFNFHGVWHFCMAATTAFIYFYLRSEREAAPAAPAPPAKA